MLIRPAKLDDVEALRRIQQEARDSARWNPADYLQHLCLVAEDESGVTGFIVVRQILREEFEILDLAVGAASRRKGIARALLARVQSECSGAGYLEVRASNLAAQSLYTSMGWRVAGMRPAYYTHPEESAVVMKI